MLIRDPLSGGSAATATTLRGVKAILLSGSPGTFTVDEKITQATTGAVGKNNSLKMLKEILFTHSLGLLYSAFTYYTGFKEKKTIMVFWALGHPAPGTRDRRRATENRRPRLPHSLPTSARTPTEASSDWGINHKLL